MKHLTRRQRDVLQALIGFVNEKGYAPSIRELGDITGLRSSSTVHDYLERLETRGYITREPSNPRTIRILRRAV